MKYKSLFFFVVASMVCSVANAQFRQDRSEVEYMFKAELTYKPFVMNLGDAGKYGYYLDNMQHAVGLAVINGVNIKQDFFLGIGLEYNFVATPSVMGDFDFGSGWHCPMGYLDFDFRPLDEEWSPMFGAKAGASYLLADGSAYGNTLTPYLEISTGVNWFFRHEVRNLEHNYQSLYLELAFAYTQQTCFIPIRMGFRF